MSDDALRKRVAPDSRAVVQGLDALARDARSKGFDVDADVPGRILVSVPLPDPTSVFSAPEALPAPPAVAASATAAAEQAEEVLNAPFRGENVVECVRVGAGELWGFEMLRFTTVYGEPGGPLRRVAIFQSSERTVVTEYWLLAHHFRPDTPVYGIDLKGAKADPLAPMRKTMPPRLSKSAAIQRMASHAAAAPEAPEPPEAPEAPGEAEGAPQADGPRGSYAATWRIPIRELAEHDSPSTTEDVAEGVASVYKKVMELVHQTKQGPLFLHIWCHQGRNRSPRVAVLLELMLANGTDPMALDSAFRVRLGEIYTAALRNDLITREQLSSMTGYGIEKWAQGWQPCARHAVYLVNGHKLADVREDMRSQSATIRKLNGRIESTNTMHNAEIGGLNAEIAT
eukprot:m51a1_g12468 hypothetical protein (399) ;mRNA; r:364-2427